MSPTPMPQKRGVDGDGVAEGELSYHTSSSFSACIVVIRLDMVWYFNGLVNWYAVELEVGRVKVEMKL